MPAAYERMGPVLDKWAPLNHKAPMMGSALRGSTLAPTWVPEDEKRRLTAYQLLAAYLNNNSRYFVHGEDAEQMDRRREYGDPTLLRDQIASSILGRGATIGVDGAEKNPTPPNDATASPEQKREFEEATKRYDAVVARLKDLTKWGTDEKFGSKVREGERKTVGLGDGIYWLTWSSKRKRPRLRVLDPGFYFPVYPAGGDSLDFPDKVHLAWEYEAPEEPGDPVSKPTAWVRRITYELVDRPAGPTKLGYQDEDDEPATKTCLMTDAAWRLNDLNRVRALFTDPFAIGHAYVTTAEDGQEMLDLDLGIDFIPVVHVAHGEGDPWGESALLNVAHILDDLTIADTDAADAADVAGGPPIAVAGGADENKLNFYGPRTVWALHSGGSASVLDTSKGLASLQTHVDRLQKRAANNSRVPQEILGQVNSTDVQSTGVLAYTFGPFESYIEEERQGRDDKFRLLLSFVQRLFIHHLVWEGPVEKANVTFGSALPSDVPNLIEQLLKMTGNRQIISRATATKVLADAGFPISDVPGEARRVEGEDFDGANLLYRSTRAPWIAAQYLGMDMPEEALLEVLAGVFRRADIQAKVRAIIEGGTPDQQVKEALEQKEAEDKTAELERRAEAATAKQQAAAKPLPPQQAQPPAPGRGGAPQPPRGGRGPNQVPGARS